MPEQARDDIHTILEEGPIATVRDFLRLRIVDWHRYRPHWKNQAHAISTVTSWFVGTCSYTIVRVPLRSFPERDDFPTWQHTGEQHYDLGKCFWNYFHATYDGRLVFDDMPDFVGILFGEQKGETHEIVGDIGMTSPLVMRLSARGLRPGKTWISVVNEERLIFVNAHVKLAHLPRMHLTEHNERWEK